MRSNFNSPLRLKDDGHTVVAAGPLNWQEIRPYKGEVTVKATITQGMVTATGDSGHHSWKPGDPQWKFEIRTDKPFEAGVADAYGVLLDYASNIIDAWPQVIILK